MINIHDLLLHPQVYEYLIATFSFLIVLAKFKNELKLISLLLQVALLLTQIAKTYFKQHPEKAKTASALLSELVGHYFNTHPEGKDIIKETDVDDKVYRISNQQRLYHDADLEGEG